MISTALPKICEDVKNGLIDPSRALGYVIQYVYSNKPFFGLQSLDDDEMSDFMLYVFEYIKKSFTTFDNSKSSFVTYLQNIIRLNYRSWIRINSRCKSIQKYVINYLKNEYYEEENEALFFSESNDNYNIEKKSDLYNTKSFQNFQLLALALKSSYFLTPQHIVTLSRKTGYAEDYIWKLKRTIDDHMIEKYLENNLRIERLNKSYFYRQRALETLTILPKTHPKYSKTYKTFLFHDKNWKSRRENIRYRTVIPINSYIAQLLHVSESVIVRAVAKAKKLSTSNSFKVKNFL